MWYFWPVRPGWAARFGSRAQLTRAVLFSSSRAGRPASSGEGRGDAGDVDAGPRAALPSARRAEKTCRMGLAVDSMRAAGRRIDEEVLTHISPAHSENINIFGAIEVDIEGELAQLGPTGYRPLRVRDTLF